MNCWGNRAIHIIQNAKCTMQTPRMTIRPGVRSHTVSAFCILNFAFSVFQLHDSSPASALILRRKLVARDERMRFQELADRAAKLPGAVTMNDPDRMLIRHG